MKTTFGTVVTILAYAASAGAQTSCPPGIPSGSTCYADQDETGAYYLIAQPPDYNGQLVLWNHGYSLSSPAPLGAGDLGPAYLLLFRDLLRLPPAIVRTRWAWEAGRSPMRRRTPKASATGSSAFLVLRVKRT